MTVSQPSKNVHISELSLGLAFILEPGLSRFRPRRRRRVTNPSREIGNTLAPFVDRLPEARSELRQFFVAILLRSLTGWIIPYTRYPNDPETRGGDASEAQHPVGTAVSFDGDFIPAARDCHDSAFALL